MGRAGIFGPAIARLLIALVTTAFLAAGPSSAQILDYGKLLGGGETSAEQSTPQQSTPLQSAPPGGRQSVGAAPTAADYGLVAESVADPMLDATRQAVTVFRARLKSTIDRLPQAWKEIKTALVQD